MGGHIDADVLGAQLGLGGLGRVAAQERAHAREQFGEAEGLGDVVVGPGVEPDDHVHLVGARGEDEDGDAPAVGADLAGDVEPVHVRQPQVEDDEVGPLDVGERLAPCGRGEHLVPFAAEGAGEGFRDRGVVFNEENSSHAPILANTGELFHVS